MDYMGSSSSYYKGSDDPFVSWHTDLHALLPSLLNSLPIPASAKLLIFLKFYSYFLQGNAG